MGYNIRPTTKAMRVFIPTVTAGAGHLQAAVALENALEGCVAETWGCLLGMHQAQHAKSLLLRLAYRRIASDEARHAQLSWDIADWADAALDAAARERIAGCRAQAVHELASTV